MTDLRLPPSPSQSIDRLKELTFTFDGRRITAFEGDTVASALHAARVKILSRSFKYHRPRGLLCCSGRCANCMMTVDGTPNVRTCTRSVTDGSVVRSQNAWPSVESDVLSILDRMDRLMPVGFYYKSLIKPKLLWHLAEPIIRRVAGLGAVDVTKVPDDAYEHVNIFAEVAVVGGGPAGCSAAIEAAEAGFRVMIVDDQPSLGSHLRDLTSVAVQGGAYSGLPGYEVAARLDREIRELYNVRVLNGATAIGMYEDNFLAIHKGSELIKLRAGQVILATGTQEVPMVFQNNDLPGVMLGTAALRMTNRYGVSPGERGVVVTNNDDGLQIAKELLAAGVEIAAVADSRSDGAASQHLRDLGVQLLSPFTIREARGVKSVRSVTLGRLQGDTLTSESVNVECDFVALSPGYDPQAALLTQAGIELTHDQTIGRMAPSKPVPGVWAAGEVAGASDAATAIIHGRLVGREAASIVTSGSVPSDVTQRIEGLLTNDRESILQNPIVNVPVSGRKKFVCPCEDVTEKDVRDGVDEGFVDVQSLKRYSTVTMGPCQGKMCQKAFTEIVASDTGQTLDEAGRTTLRPPVQPVPMGALAGSAHLPFRRTPLHHRHLELGGDMVVVGEWLRPNTYGSAVEEVAAVRERVGMIDVSTLGKLEVTGLNAPTFLDRVYTNRMSNLRHGRIRYGIICSDSGIILDDGSVTRLGDDYYVTTGTGNIDLVDEWFQQWLVGSGACVHVTNVTHGIGAFNVAGPSARDTLSKLTSVDLSSASFRYMRAATGEVAGVPATLLRMGFVGETGWEVHVPAEYAEYVWDAILDAGASYGIRPFGVEAQRVLRLEKKHFIPGQDTDIMSNPLEADTAWAVRMDRDDFIGRTGLAMIEDRGLRNKLVGFVMEDGVVPNDGVPVMLDGYPVGKVTSSRRSPGNGRGFGLAWVPVDLSTDGTRIDIWVDRETTAAARVVDEPVYDPAGERVRS